MLHAVRTIKGLHRQASPLQPVSRDGELPLSFSQQRLWFLHQLEPSSPAYNTFRAYRIKGQLNIAALEQSLNKIVQRHEILRTTFPAKEGQPVQAIDPTLTLTLPVVDIQEFPEPERDTEALRLTNEAIQRPFNLAQGPLVRATLLQLGQEEYVLFMITHHILFAGQAWGEFNRELSVLYEAFSAGKPSPLPDLPIQYADFAHWQREWLQGEVLETLLSYWKQQLGGRFPLLQLPTDRPRPAVQTFQSAKQSFALSKNLTESLKVLSQREGVTLFTKLLAAFQVLLYRYTAQQDILIFSPAVSRTRFEFRRLIGLFTNFLPLRTNLSDNPTFRELLGRVRDTVMGAYAHQEMPLEKLVEVLQPQRSLSYTSLFQVMFIYHNTPTSPLTLSGLTLSPLKVGKETAKFDLSLFMEDSGQNLTASLGYKTDLFDAATIAQMLEHFQTLLEGIVTDPKQLLSELPCLTEAERQQLPVFRDHSQFAPESDTARLEKTYQAPKNALELQLTKIWEKVLRVQPIGVHDNFFDIGGHSLLAVTLLSEVEKKFGKNIPWTTLFQAQTIEQLAHLMSQKESIRDSSLVIIQAGDKNKKRPPLFFIQVLGKGLGLCRPLARHLGADQPIYGLSTGIMDRKQAQLIKGDKERNYYIKEMQTIQPEGPYFLAGIYCGGRTAFEVAQLLHKQGQKIALLALLDTRVVLPPSASKTTITLRKRLYAHWNQFLQNGFQSLLKKGKKRLIWLIRMLQNKSMKIGCKFYDRLGHPLPPTLQDFAIEEAARTTFTYLPQKYPGRVTFFRAIDTSVFDDPLIGWHNVAEDGLEVHDIPGDTSSMLQEPHVQVLAKKLKACIDKNNVVLPNE
jgi:thioesterase domain-containing protein/acyl carrier protein